MILNLKNKQKFFLHISIEGLLILCSQVGNQDQNAPQNIFKLYLLL